MNKQTHRKKTRAVKTKQINKQTPGSETTEFQSYFKFWSYSSGIQSWCWCIGRSSFVVSPGDWLVSSILFFCLPVKLKLWGEVALPDNAGWSELLIFPADSCVTLHLKVFGQLLPQGGGAVQVWVLPCGSGDQLSSLLLALLWRWLFVVLIYWGFFTGSLFLCPVHFLWAINLLY
jgi:hypothetical protein